MTTAEDTIYIRLGGQRHAMHGKDARVVIDHILPGVDGFATQAEVAAAALKTGTVTTDWIQQVLSKLVDMGGCVVDREEPGDQALRQHYLTQITHFGQHVSYPTVYQKRLQASTVSIIGLEYIGSMIVQRLAEAGIGHLRAVGNPKLLPSEAPFVTQGQGGHTEMIRHTLLAGRAQALGFRVTYEGFDAAPGDHLDWQPILANCHLALLVLPRRIPALLRAFNQACLAQNMPFLPIWIEEMGAQVGPLVIPYETACLLCHELRRRERLSSQDLRSMQQRAEAIMPVWEERAWLIPWASAVASIAACEVVTALAQHRQPTSYGHELFINAYDWQLHTTPVWKVSRCLACSRLHTMPSSQPFALPHQEDVPYGP